MRCGRGRRTSSPIAGLGRDRGRGPLTTSARNRPTCSVPCAQNSEPARALVLPFCNSEAMQLHLNEIASKVSPGAHAIIILDQAGWHGAKELKVPHNSR